MVNYALKYTRSKQVLVDYTDHYPQHVVAGPCQDNDVALWLGSARNSGHITHHNDPHAIEAASDSPFELSDAD